AAERICELVDEEEQEKETAVNEIKHTTGAVELDSVAFGYDDHLLMHDLNVSVKPGQTVAIVGPTGAGKTTLINLLMRFYEVNAGRILFEVIDICDISRNNLREQFGLVIQDTWLFNGTIYDNIADGKHDATKEEVLAAAKAARANQFIRTLSDGYDTMVNEEGTNISQGQRQLLTIARAILSDSPIMILDEATSSVDT